MSRKTGQHVRVWALALCAGSGLSCLHAGWASTADARLHAVSKVEQAHESTSGQQRGVGESTSLTSPTPLVAGNSGPTRGSGPGNPQVRHPDDLVNRPGELEFSGQVIVLPRTIEQIAAAHGVDHAQAQGLLDEAVAAFEARVVQRVESTGEMIVRVPAGIDDAAYCLSLRETGLFAFVTPDWLCYPVSGVDDPLFPNQWQHRALQSDRVWDITQGSDDVILAIVDTGVDAFHPDLNSVLVLPGHNSVGKSAFAPVGGAFNDVSLIGHGTRCAGLAAASANNGQGVSGLAPGVRVLAVRCTNQPSGAALLSDMLNGAEWASRSGAQIVSLSFSGVTSPSVGIRGSVLKSLGSLMFFAAGNSGAELSAAADWSDVVIVSAVDFSDARYTDSNFGQPVDVAAPGVAVLTTLPQNRYVSATGTSFAAPQAAAAAALLWSISPAISPDDVQSLLVSSAIDIFEPGRDVFSGGGRLSPLRAAQQLLSLSGEYLAPSALAFPTPGLRATFYDLTNAQIPVASDQSGSGDDSLKFMPVLSQLSAESVVISPDINYAPGALVFPQNGGPNRGVGVTFDGFVQIDSTGLKTFALSNIDSARLTIDGLLVINNDGRHDLQERTGSLRLQAGYHSIRVEYYSHNENTAVVLSTVNQAGVRTPIPASKFVRVITSLDVADIADWSGEPGRNGHIDEGDYNLFFTSFFFPNYGGQLYADVADDAGNPGPNGVVNEGDYNAFFFWYFAGL
ncbi:MAG: S8 family serine peptidase [Phycisphaerales bacterium]|nr:S8 family serine peptidase [Phycisphaerales bacterium]